MEDSALSIYLHNVPCSYDNSWDVAVVNVNLYRTKVTYAVKQVRVKCLKNSGRQWNLWHLNAVR